METSTVQCTLYSTTGVSRFFIPYLELTKVGSTPQPVNKILHIFQDEISEGEEQAGQPGLPAQEEGATRGKQAQAART